ncbi:transcriptional repressor MprA [Thermoplasmatales archaeon]|nr:transcriptional repressor MprA [Thermoplasmatales archaeon]
MPEKKSNDNEVPTQKVGGYSQFTEGLKSLHQEIMFLQMELVRSEGIIMPQYFILRYIGINGPQHLSSIAGFLRVSNATVTGLTDTLESQGWVRRQPDPNDRRVILLTLTEKSLTLFSRMEQYQARLMSEVLGDIPEQRLSELGEILSGLAMKVRKVVMKNTDRKEKEIL